MQANRRDYQECLPCGWVNDREHSHCPRCGLALYSRSANRLPAWDFVGFRFAVSPSIRLLLERYKRRVRAEQQNHNPDRGQNGE